VRGVLVTIDPDTGDFEETAYVRRGDRVAVLAD
jgi:hypothetical protein